MVNRAERMRRRAIASATRALEHAEADAQRPLDKSVLRGLLTHLKQVGLASPKKSKTAARCDHTLKQTRGYLETAGVWRDELGQWFEDYDASCDCEVVRNVFGYWTPDLLAE